MIVVDTSVWIEHLRRSDAELVEALEQGAVLLHPAVLGEIALGSLARREPVLAALAALRRPVVATDAEVLRLVDDRRLAGTGIGWIDAHLLASTLLTPAARLWTNDRRLAEVAGQNGVDRRG